MSGEGGLDALLDAIARASGLSPRDDWALQASRGLEHIAVRRGTTVEALSRETSAWPTLLPELLDHLTVRETFFFRHSGHFDFLVDTLEARLTADPLASACVLSAGCASGEEPYSIAIAVHARLGVKALARVRILASDISPEAIRRARAAVYGAWAFREAPAWLSAGYFRRGEGSGAEVADLVRRAVTFDVGHVVHHAATLPAGSVDAVFFRNVAIYLSPSVIADAYREFHRVLRPGGLLLVAPADPRPSTGHFVDVGHESTSIYRTRAPGFEPDVQPVPSSRRGRAGPRSSRSAHLASTSRPSLAAAGRPSRAAVRAAPAPPPAPAPAADRDAEAEALRRADRSQPAAVLAIVTALLERPSTAPIGYMIRAQVSLERGEPEAAVEDLRRTLFLRPEHRLARYWYVVALQRVGQVGQALTQGRSLEALLAACANDALLEDGETTAGQLLDAVRFVKEGLL